MSLNASNAIINVQDGQGSQQAVANGGNALVTPGSLLSFSLQSTSGVARWQLTLICPSYPALHLKTFDWFQGQANLLQVQLPAVNIAGTNPLSGLQVVSVVTDGLQSIAQALAFLQTRNWATVPMQHFVRFVQLTALAAYTNVNGVLTENANGALSTADGGSPAVGDLLLLPNGIAASAADAGIYQVTNLGGASSKWVLTSAPDWALGSQVMPKTEILVSEGTVYANTTWVVTNTGLTNVVGTTSFTFYPRRVTQQFTLVSGSTGAIANFPILATAKLEVDVTRLTPSGTASTITYQPVGTLTAGALGTATATVDATVAAGTVNAADVSTVNVTLANPV